LLITCYPNSAGYLNRSYNDSDAEKLQFLLDLRPYIEDEILNFDPLNINSERSVIGLLAQVNTEINYRLSQIYQFQEQHMQRQHIIAKFVNDYSRGLEISASKIEHLQENVLRRISSISNPDNEAKRQLLILCGQLVLTRCLFDVYTQRTQI
jgi:hypothetical protein